LRPQQGRAGRPDTLRRAKLASLSQTRSLIVAEAIKSADEEYAKFLRDAAARRR
jgi:hypothetical protein